MTNPPDKREAPVPLLMMALMVAVVVLALVGWFLLPNSPLAVAVLAIVVLGAVFFAVARILSLRQLREPPGRHPTPPPSSK